ncbi:PucR family transcriptional regulator [Jiangella alba]|uniref:PucR C-terminal helix-turn-helix domain-containing protein n=1 Tax=Jiangella alba TaxID=561176 RepID=A0A1H5L602_9ACTN|nr:helix-turn-helix domain-containing protein [Jiangella alba]SEE72384.1 PucR C-terminal helix-turn-helix domain-containing protein [Jiangella alba]
MSRPDHPDWPAASDGPSTTLARILEDAGHTLLRPAFEGQDLGRVVDGLVIHDPADQLAWPPRPLVLGVGVQPGEQLTGLLEQLARRDGGALVVRENVLASLSQRAVGAPILTLGEERSWMQLAATLAPLVSGASSPISAAPLGGVPTGDLFALANAIAEILDAPVTVEDRDSRVLAFSIRQEEADPSRVGAILNRQVTPWATQDLQERGIFRQLYRTQEALFVEPPESGHGGWSMPRVVLGIRAGDEILGSVWAAVPGPLSDDRMQHFRDLQGTVAVHLLSHRANANVERRMRSDLTAQVLAGGPEAEEVAARLGLPRRPLLVLAVALPDGEDDPGRLHADRAAELLRLGDAFDMYLGTCQRGASAALVGDVVYGIVPLPAGAGSDPESDRGQRMAKDFLARVGRQSAAVIGVSGVAPDAGSLARAREDADRALRLARSSPGGDRVCSTVEHAFELLMMEMTDLVSARGMSLSSPFARLVEHDARHGSGLVPTLRAWLDHFGDNIAAAASLHVHPNTFRYRLRRVGEISGMDLDDGDERLSLMLQFRLFMRS